MKKIKILCSLLLAIFISCSSCWGSLIVHFIDVGEGDSIFIQIPENENILIDTGMMNT